MVDLTTKSEPGSGTYVLAWILSSVAANVTSYIVAFVAYANIRTVDDLMQRTALLLPVGVVVSAAVIIGVYSLFPRIHVSKVIPYFWGLGALGVLASLGKNASSGVDFPGLYYVLVIVEFVLMVFALTWGFRRLGRL